MLSGYISAPNVIFAGIKKLMPGYSMSFSNGSGKNCYGDVVTNKYWDIRYDDSEHKVRTENEYAEKLLYELKNSVKRMLISDVPVGAFLSGGIDSSSIVAFMSQLIPGKVKTFSIGFEEKTFNELDSANKVAKIFGTEHYSEVFSDAKMLQTMPQVIDFLDEPLADPSIIPTFLLSRFTRKEVTVALSGDGGDELFAGYPVYQAHRLAKYYKKIPKNIRERIIKK